MRPQTPFPPNTVVRMKTLLSSTNKIDEYRRIQSVYLRAKYGYSAWRHKFPALFQAAKGFP